MASGGPDRESGDDARAEDLAILKSFPPRTLGTLLEQREIILRYAATSPGIVAVCFCMAYVVMQSLAIPGTLVLSVLAGAIYGHWRGWALVSGISTLGALSCYTLSLLIGRPIVRALWPLRTERFAAEVAARRGQLLPYVIFLRVTPLLPNTFINVASPLAGVPVWPFSLGTLLGCMPNNFVAVGAGTRLSSMNSLADLYDARAILLGLGLSQTVEELAVGKEQEGAFLFWYYVAMVVFLILMAGLMSGLTLGLMSLDSVDLEILRRTGTPSQQASAAAIMPLLRNPHRLLVTLLLGNSLAAEALPLYLDRLANPITAVIVSVTVVLIFGEIIPQAVCSSYGLEAGAAAAPFVHVFMFLCAPLAWPIGWVLDRLLGAHRTALFKRAQLKALVDIHHEGQTFGGQLSSDEVGIIKGALDLTSKTADQAMTPLDLVFMLSSDAVLDADTQTAILASGHSRIPVFRAGNRNHILGIALAKELVQLSGSETRLVGELKIRSLPYLLASASLFIGWRGASQAAGENRDKDLFVDWQLSELEPVGIITIEDVLEELLQFEIVDETDQYVDNMHSMRVNARALASSLPLHLRRMLTSRQVLPRIGAASELDTLARGGAGPRAPARGSLNLPVLSLSAPSGLLEAMTSGELAAAELGFEAGRQLGTVTEGADGGRSLAEQRPGTAKRSSGESGDGEAASIPAAAAAQARTGGGPVSNAEGPQTPRAEASNGPSSAAQDNARARDGPAGVRDQLDLIAPLLRQEGGGGAPKA
ncbi:Protein MAM3 [Auxenochlorella protothecoides]|uniref:Protein MAM3 n=1 Tax=Auxenochlorella protothecoides TaxID=3075 RepID=A0A087SK42_AUXPR|nr:Protein MAM3 [Auxenochlorella protothecoides]KFM26096.1 Protein MAM3 [Auxenochlorella protothecoides]